MRYNVIKKRGAANAMKSIDRFEGDIAIIDDDGKLYGMRRDMLPSDAAERRHYSRR